MCVAITQKTAVAIIAATRERRRYGSELKRIACPRGNKPAQAELRTRQVLVNRKPALHRKAASFERAFRFKETHAKQNIQAPPSLSPRIGFRTGSRVQLRIRSCDVVPQPALQP